MADRDILVRLKLEAAGNMPVALKDTAAAGAKASTEQSRLNIASRQVDAAKTQQLAKANADAASQAKRAADETKRLAAEQSRLRPGATGAAGAQRAPAGLPGNAVEAKTAPGLGGAFGFNADVLQNAALAFAALKGLAAAVSTTAKAIDALRDETLSLNQAIRKTAESVPLVGEVYKAIGELADAISGKTDAIRKASREEAKATAQTSINVGLYQQTSPLNLQLQQADARAKALAQAPLVEFNAPARDSQAGEVAFAQYERRQPLEVEKRRAQAEAEAAAAVAKQAADERKRLQGKLPGLESATASAQAAFDVQRKAEEEKKKNQSAFEQKAKTITAYAFPTIPITAGSLEDTEKIKAANNLKVALEKEKEIRSQLTTAAQQEANAVKAAAEAESKLRQANLALAKDELAAIKEKQAAIKSSAQSFGSLSALDKQAALESAQAFAEKGYNNLTPEQKASLQGAGFGQQLAFAAQQSAINSPDFAAIAQLMGAEFDLKGLQNKELELQAQIAVDIQMDEKTLANDIAAALKEALTTIIKELKELAKAELQKVEVGQVQANAGQ